MADNVNHPEHYTAFGAEVIEITEYLNFCRGNAVKYIARAGIKDPEKELEDLRKAAWYIDREITRIEKSKERKLVRHSDVTEVAEGDWLLDSAPAGDEV